jgi:hypothetical protein
MEPDGDDDPPLEADDNDADSIPDQDDLCSDTPPGAVVWKMGQWMGCSAGQFKDPPRTTEPDADQDGIADAEDVCSRTTARSVVWLSGDWQGCAAGQFRDADRP